MTVFLQAGLITLHMDYWSKVLHIYTESLNVDEVIESLLYISQL